MTIVVRLLAGAFSPVLLVAIISQGWLYVEDFLADGLTAVAGATRYLGYFTVLTNLLVVAVLARAALSPGDRAGLNAPRWELLTVTSILFVGAVYNLMLASLWHPQGLRKLNDVILHDLSPLLFVLFWLLRQRGGLSWRDALFAAIWPVSYSVFALARGAVDGFYPYFFLDPSATPLPQLAGYLVGLTCSFFLAALVLAAFDACSAQRGREASQRFTTTS